MLNHLFQWCNQKSSEQGKLSKKLSWFPEVTIKNQRGEEMRNLQTKRQWIKEQQKICFTLNKWACGASIMVQWVSYLLPNEHPIWVLVGVSVASLPIFPSSLLPANVSGESNGRWPKGLSPTPRGSSQLLDVAQFSFDHCAHLGSEPED